MAHGDRAEWKSNHRKEINGKRMGARLWLCRGKIAKQISKAVERMLQKKLLKKELDDL